VRFPGLCIAAFATWVAASPAGAGAYRIVLGEPAGGRLLHGYGGLEAADQRTDGALVRLIAPGNDIHERGTVRVLVMNLGPSPFEFGPDQVTLTLSDGTVLNPVPVDQMEDGRELVEREMQHAAANDLRNRNNLAGLDRQANGAGTLGRSVTGTAGRDLRADQSLWPGTTMLDSIYQLLVPLTVEPQKAWGGYYVFNVPKGVFRKKADQPITIIVRTGAEEHRFTGVMKWK